MAELKTKQTKQSVEGFIDNLPEEKLRKDCYTIVHLMQKITGLPAKMWGPSIIGFGQYHYKYESGHEGDICLIGFSPRKANLSLYVLAGFPGQEDLLEKLGKHKAGKGCLYIKKLEDVNPGTLETLIKKSFDFMRKKHPGN
jgi:hypothetical protein